jgi:hypothetical protein
MAGADSNFNPMDMMLMGDPQSYQQALGFDRREALARALLERGMRGPDTYQMGHQAIVDPYSGLANAGNEILGAYLLKGAQQGRAKLWANMLQGGGADAPDTGVAPVAVTPGLKNAGGGIVTPNNNFGGVTPGARFGQYDEPAPNAGAASSPMGNFVPDIPGVDPREKTLRYMQDPQGYMKAYWDSKGLTNEYKNALAAAGGDPGLASRLVSGKLAKERMIEERPGGVAFDPLTGATLSNPGPRGIATGFGPDGRPYQYNAQGSQAAMASASAPQPSVSGAIAPMPAQAPSAPPNRPSRADVIQEMRRRGWVQ